MRKIIAIFTLMLSSSVALSNDAVPVRQMSMELALDVAKESVLACREMGYQTSAVVVDRSANVMAVVRDTLAARFTIKIAEEKANAVIMSGVATKDFVENRGDIRNEMNHVDGIIMLEGGLPVAGGGYVLGAVGVSGAPGGEKDAECAIKGLEKVQERLDFID